MKKKLFGMLTLLLALCLLCACGKQKEEPSAEEPPSTPFQNVYDDGGNLLVEYLVDDDGTYKGKKEYLYEEGQMKKRTYDKNDKLTEEVAEEYDAQGKLIKELVYDGIKNTKAETVYTYNAEGKWAELTYTFTDCYLAQFPGHKAIDIFVVKYNEKQQPVRHSAYNHEGILLWYMEYEYEGDLKVKTTRVNRRPREYEYWISAYDEEGHCISDTYYNGDDKVTEVCTYIWEDGHHAKTVSSKGDYTLYHYDEKGICLGYSSYDADGQLTFTTMNNK